MTDGDTEEEWGYVCEGCWTETNYDDFGNQHKEDKDKIRRGVNTEATAETLASIHGTLTGHSPGVRRFA